VHSIGNRAFPVAGSRLWNSLLPDVTSKLNSFPDHFLPSCFRFNSVHCV